MPHVDGYQVCSQIIATHQGWNEAMMKIQSFRRYKATNHCPVVAVTAFTDDLVTKKAAEVGICGVIHKPVTTEALLEVCKKHGIII